MAGDELLKVLFVGSSLHGSTVDLTGLDVRPPARKGDVLAALGEGAVAIGLVDGEFGQAASVGHKEILFALSGGIAVFGASSMGALRAAECAAFGMIPVGEIANAYLTGEIDDDAAVALSMAPQELGSMPLTEPLVDAEATLGRLLEIGTLDESSYAALRERARSLHFTQRTDAALFADTQDADSLLELYRLHHVGLKRRDAELLVGELRSFDPKAPRNVPAFAVAQSVY